MNSQLAVFREIAPEFSLLSDDEIQSKLDLSSREVTNNSFPEAIREKMIAYLTAHYLTISHKRKGASGEVIAVSEGKLSVKYASGYSVVKSDLAATGYGKIYDRLIRSYTVTPLTRVC